MITCSLTSSNVSNTFNDPNVFIPLTPIRAATDGATHTEIS